MLQRKTNTVNILSFWYPWLLTWGSKTARSGKIKESGQWNDFVSFISPGFSYQRCHQDTVKGGETLSSESWRIKLFITHAWKIWLSTSFYLWLSFLVLLTSSYSYHISPIMLFTTLLAWPSLHSEVQSVKNKQGLDFKAMVLSYRNNRHVDRYSMYLFNYLFIPRLLHRVLLKIPVRTILYGWDVLCSM